MKKGILVGVMMLLGIILTACGSENNLLSPQEVVDTMLQESDEALSYYGEYTTIYDEETEDYVTKEWIRKDQKRRIELTSEENGDQMVMINDGKTVTMYDKVENTAMVMVMDDEDLEGVSNQTPREQAENMLDLVKDTHELSAGDDAEIAGRSTYHIIAKVKEEKSLLGDIEMWVDKETWLPLKTKTDHGGNGLLIEYTKIDYQAEMDDALFVLDLPEDVVVETLDGGDYEPEEVTEDEVLASLGSFYKLSEESGVELKRITVLNGLDERPEFSFDYEKDGMPALFISIFEEFPDVEDFGGVEEEVMIRGKEASKMEMGEFRSVGWTEEGLRYVVVIENPEIEFKDVEQYLEEMILVE